MPPDDKPAAGSAGSCSDDACCVSPCDPPWLPDDQCFITYDSRLFRRPIDTEQAPPAVLDRGRPLFEFRITFEHRICRRGKQQGPLVYTVTLLPGERVNLYQSDRYRRITSEQDRFSVATTFMQFTSAIHQARATGSFQSVTDHLSSVKTGGSASFGGGLAGLFGAPSGTVSTSSSSTDHNQVSVGFVSDQFNQSVSQASLLTHAERSVVVSTFEDTETANVTVRTISNENECRAVTYFVRQVVELFSVSTAVYDITYRVIAAGVPAEWHSLDDVEGLPDGAVKALKRARELLPRLGDTAERPRLVSIPTDGTVYDPELANCCSCEPERAHRASLRDALLELEIERRKLLLAKGDLSPFEPAPGAAEPAPLPTP
jgi:thermitase